MTYFLFNVCQATYSLQQRGQTDTYEHFIKLADVATNVAVNLEEMPMFENLLKPEPPMFGRWVAVGSAAVTAAAIHTLSGRAANAVLGRTNGEWLFRNFNGDPVTSSGWFLNERQRMHHPDYCALRRSWARSEALFCGSYAVDKCRSTSSAHSGNLIYVDWVVPLTRVIQRITEFHVVIYEHSSNKIVARVVVDNPSKPLFRKLHRTTQNEAQNEAASDTPAPQLRVQFSEEIPTRSQAKVHFALIVPLRAYIRIVNVLQVCFCTVCFNIGIFEDSESRGIYRG